MIWLLNKLYTTQSDNKKIRKVTIKYYYKKLLKTRRKYSNVIKNNLKLDLRNLTYHFSKLDNYIYSYTVAKEILMKNLKGKLS